MKLFKTLISTILIISLISVFIFPVIAMEQKENYGLYNVYTDNMLFKQNSEGILAGRSKAGSIVTAVLYDKSNNIVLSSKAQSDRSSRFRISFRTPDGSFENYKIVIYSEDNVIDSIADIVFGELWLAGGQSNMMFPLGGAEIGEDMQEKKITGSEWIRFLSTPAIPEYNGSSDNCPLYPLEEIKDCFWHKANDEKIYGNSAVGYFFAESLLKKLNVPIGILDSNLGGSSIASWLSRDAIDSDSSVKNDLLNAGEYFDAENWSETGHDPYRDMTVNFNKKIYPLRNFRLSGIIWYQGETDFIYQWSEERYARSLALLQKSYSDLFNSSGSLPLIVTQLAPHSYARMHELAEWNAALCEFQSESPRSRAVITNYDVDLDYDESVGSIHPSHKYEIGCRFAEAADRMLYNKENNYTAAYYESSHTENNDIIIKLKNTGSGLVINGKDCIGFSISDENGVFIKAKAEIISKDCVRVYSDNIKNPVAAAYAYCENNHYSNLFSTDENGLYMPVSPFITDKEILNVSWGGNEWTDCESDSIWHLGNDAAYYDTWNSRNADISFDSDSAFSGERGLHVVSDKKIFTSFSVNPVLYRKYHNKKTSFGEWNNDWSDYASLSFMIKNNGKKDIILKRAVIDNKGIGIFSPAIDGTTSVSQTIPADDSWHKITLNLNRLYLFSNEASAYYSNKKIDNVINFILEFDGKNPDISIDDFNFDSEEFDKDERVTFSADYKNVKGIFTLFTALITNLIGLFVKQSFPKV